ncbi:hypothetical protein L1049_002418 [Liquidambar formosana]|uniref:Protein kinase domain-containing protein n=1 Tax=Liquidambar formosana TaxID=63359 RepID=A0AAP0NJL0_LIQFO
MGCVYGKSLMYSPPRVLEKLKLDNGYVKGGNGRGPTGQKQQVNEPVVKLLRNEVKIEKVRVLNGGSGGGGGGGKVVAREGEQRQNNGGVGGRVVASEGEQRQNTGGVGGNVSQRIRLKKIGGDELVNGWPKWLIDNIRGDALDGLVPKSADSYDKLAKVGQGTYSNVYKARDRDTGKIVALKKVRFDTSEPESVKFMAREIMILQKLNHPNIIKLEGLATSRMQYSLYLVFDFMPSDLSRVVSRPGTKLTEPQVKSYMQQLLSGLQHCHERGILHRDIKGSNLLIDKNGMLKIADFGLANYFFPKPKRPLTSRVVTLWYRAPELLLGSTDYGVGIDLWSAGCLLAEMFVGRPIMPGRTEVEQLHRIFKLSGSPSEDYWRKMKLPTSFRPPQQYKPSFQEAFKDFPTSSFGLLTKLLDLDPPSRGSSTSALHSEFFSSSPLACDLSGLPIIYKEAAELTQTNDWKRRSILKGKQQSRTNNEDRREKGLTTEQAKGETGSSKELEKNAELNTQSQEMGNSGSSTSSSMRPSRFEERSLPFPSPVLYPLRSFSFRTEAHPNVPKNIKNFPVQTSRTENTNHDEGERSILSRRSLSTLDFRRLNVEEISKLFRLDNN